MNAAEGTLTRRRRFVQLPDDLVFDSRVSAHAVRLWACLDKYAGADGRAFPKVATLAADLHTSTATIDRALRCLVTTGWITRRRRGFSNVIDTVLNDEPTPPATTETSPVTRPETSPVTCPEKDTHLKDKPPYPPARPAGRATTRTPLRYPSARGPLTERSPAPSARRSRALTTPAGPEGTDGHPEHPHHPNAARVCARLHRARRLPLTPEQLLAWCYRLGGGDPWTGQDVLKQATDRELDTARDPGAALRARLARQSP